MLTGTNVIYLRLCPYIHNIHTNAGAVICGTQCTLRRTCICQRCRTAANMLNFNRIDFHLCGAALRQTAGRGRCSLRSKRICINIGRKNHSFNGFRTVHHGNIYRIAAVAGNCCFRCFGNRILLCNYSRIICGRNPLGIPACLNCQKSIIRCFIPCLQISRCCQRCKRQYRNRRCRNSCHDLLHKLHCKLLLIHALPRNAFHILSVL